MKKIVYLILAVLFLFPIVAKADVGAPEIKAYTVVSKSGQDEPYYDWDLTEKGIVPAGQEVEINMEEKIDGVLYGISYNTLNGYIIKLSDFKVSKGQELGTSEAKYVAKVFAKDGLVVYAGPSYINEEVGKLAYGDDIKVGEFEGDAWLYVEKGSIKGYVDTGFGSGFGVGILTKGDKIDAVTNKIYNEYYLIDSEAQFLYTKMVNTSKLVILAYHMKEMLQQQQKIVNSMKMVESNGHKYKHFMGMK